MRIVHILRKPLSEGTVAANVLKHGAGGLNIDASRVGLPFVSAGGNNFDVWRSGEDRPPIHGKPTSTVRSGRWPANVILQHLDGCRCAGVKRVKKGGGTGHASSNLPHKEGFLTGKVKGGFTTSHYDEDGKESVANWICEPGCPVKALDNQTADHLHLAGNVNNNGTGDGKNYTASAYHISYEGRADRDQSRRDTTTGASRFFKQVGGTRDSG